MTIEAEIENGKINCREITRLPLHARVLITFISSPTNQRPAFGTPSSPKICFTEDAFAPLTGKDLAEWGLA